MVSAVVSHALVPWSFCKSIEDRTDQPDEEKKVKGARDWLCRIR